MSKAQELLQKMQRGELVIGAHVFFTDCEITEMLGYVGYEFVWIDGEHSAHNKETILHHIIAASSAGTASFVRVPWNDPVLLKPVLEMGPDGVIVPMISTAEQAREAVSACTYPSGGTRGFGPRRAIRYGAIPTKQYLEEVDRSFLRIMQVETVEGVGNLEEIAAVPGVDMIMIGPNDLSASAGHLGEIRHPDMMPIYDEIARKCKKAGIPFGVSLGSRDRETISEWIARGITIIGCGDDISFIQGGGQDNIAFVKGLPR